MLLSDHTIREAIASGRIVIDPFDADCIQPSSVDLHLDHRFLEFRNHTRGVIDVKEDLSDLTAPVEATDEDRFILHPGEFVLGSTAERVALPDDLVARLEGKSSLGRLGLLIHSTAGFVDAGWDGQLTLELSNVANLPITLYPGMKIGQISFVQMTTPADRPYGASPLGSKYYCANDSLPDPNLPENKQRLLTGYKSRQQPLIRRSLSRNRVLFVKAPPPLQNSRAGNESSRHHSKF